MTDLVHPVTGGGERQKQRESGSWDTHAQMVGNAELGRGYDN